MSYGYIYKTTNILDNKVYIGQRMGKFTQDYFGSGKYIKSAVNKYGKENFKLEVIVFAEDKTKINELEKFYIAEYRRIFGKDNLYNITDGGEGFKGSFLPILRRNIGKTRQPKARKNG